MKQVVRLRLRWMLVVYFILVAAVLIAGFWDLRWVFIGLILIFIIFPIAMFNAYFYYLLTPDAKLVIGRKKVIFLDVGSIEVVYYTEDEDGQPIPSGLRQMLPATDIKFIKSYGSNLIVGLSSGRPGFIVIPHDSLPDGLLNRLIDNKEQIYIES